MHICPEGHQSVAQDYCDECGRAIVPGYGEVADPPGLVRVPDGGAPSPGTPAQRCPICGNVYGPGDDFCESCGHQRGDASGGAGGETGDDGEGGDGGDHPLPPPPPPPDRDPSTPVWTVRVMADHDYFMRVLDWDGPDAHSMRFPHEDEAWSVELAGESMRIGRRNSSVSSAPVEISLDDPGVSRRHATLLRCGDGTWEVVDLGSVNGTTINSGYDRVRRDPVHLKDGDRVHVGAWTTLEIRRLR